MVHRIIATFAVNLVWNTCVARNFSTWLCLAGCWIHERLLTISRHWYLMSSACLIIGHLGQTPPFPSISGNNASLPRSSLQLSQSFLQLTLLFWTLVSPSHRLRCWQLSYTRSCIRKKKNPTFCKRLERWRRLQCLSDYVFIVLITILF